MKFLFVFAGAICLLGFPAIASAQSGEVNPLFPVGLEHEFPRAAETFEEIKALILENYCSSEITVEPLVLDGEPAVYEASIYV